MPSPLTSRIVVLCLLSVLFFAVAAGVLSSIPAQAAGSSVVTHAFIPSVGWFTPAGDEVVQVQVFATANDSYLLSYQVFDFGGGFSANGVGSIPASSVNVSGGSVNSGNVTFTLNVNTCDVPDFTSTTCGILDLAWVEVPAFGSMLTRGDTQTRFGSGGKVVTNGETTTFFASTTGTALGFDAPPHTVGTLTKGTNVTVTVLP